jgi:hypothetical protein
MKQVIAALTVSLALALPASSSAFWLQNLRGEGTQSDIRFEVEVCNARGKVVHLNFLYSDQEEEGRIWQVKWTGYQPRRDYCGNWWIHQYTPMWKGQWGVGVAVTIGRTTETLSPVTFDIEE